MNNPDNSCNQCSGEIFVITNSINNVDRSSGSEIVTATQWVIPDQITLLTKIVKESSIHLMSRWIGSAIRDHISCPNPGGNFKITDLTKIFGATLKFTDLIKVFKRLSKSHTQSKPCIDFRDHRCCQVLGGICGITNLFHDPWKICGITSFIKMLKVSSNWRILQRVFGITDLSKVVDRSPWFHISPRYWRHIQNHGSHQALEKIFEMTVPINIMGDFLRSEILLKA